MVFQPESQPSKSVVISRVFSPAAPISRRDLFAGRTQQIRDLLDVISQTGQHAIIYGERGVGKTSLASVMGDILNLAVGQKRTVVTARVNCDGTDTFGSVWRKALSQIGYNQEEQTVGFFADPKLIQSSLDQLLPADDGDITPGTVLKVLRILEAGASIPVVFIDEFDRIGGQQTRAHFADLIKGLSDQLIGVTLVLVGVADSVDELLDQHKSIERSLAQIRMPRMSVPELEEIINRGLEQAGMTITPAARERITQLSQGLPHYTHSLGQGSARAALAESRDRVTLGDANKAIDTAIDRVQEGIARAYHKATSSPRKTLYPEVLMACALAKVDDLGYFAAVDVRGPLGRITGKPYEIPAFSRHLHALTEEDRGAVLQRTGQARRYRFRFVNPLLQPFVIMKGLAQGKIDAAMLKNEG